MYVCRVCDKTYQSRGSLTRHLRNHSVNNSQHICPTCGVAFSRRDLLRRHFQIHQSENNALSPSAGTTRSLKSARRRRCHTACQRCREARVKCNGKHPCAHCITSQTECRFRPRAHRVSRIVDMESAPDPDSNPDISNSGDGDEASPQTQPEAVMPVTPGMLQSPVSQVQLPNWKSKLVVVSRYH